jgi:ATP-binding cassette, subfamily C, type I secretion system permease/ATPase
MSGDCVGMTTNKNEIKDVLREILLTQKRTFLAVGGFSFFVNLLMLVSPLYMLQLYDRVLSSGSASTLVALTAIALFLLGMLGILEIVRSRLMVRVGVGLNDDLQENVFDSVFQDNLTRGSAGQNQSIRDLEAVRQFFSGNTLFAFFDAPWTPLFIILIFILHPYLGLVALFGALAIFGLAVMTELVSRKLIQQAAGYSIQSNSFAEASLRNADVLQAMGMLEAVRARWREKHDPAVKLLSLANDRIGLLLGATKAFRFTLQVLILGTGGYLALEQIITPGVMIAASIIMGRALAPVEQAIGAWRGFVSSRAAYNRLNEALARQPEQADAMPLPRPAGTLSVEKLFAAPPGFRHPFLKAINFKLDTGELLGLIGPSASGKSTLARLMTGVWEPFQGAVRLGGINISGWDPADKGQYLGYLPQDIELLDGSVGENIARFGAGDPDAIIKAANEAGCHEMILRLSDGYETQIGQQGCLLSAGQRQRLGLARALFGDPVLVVLDEPNSNLDTEGEAKLVGALVALKRRGATAIIITHNIRMLQSVDKVLVLNEGTMGDFGPASEVLQKYMRPAPQKLEQNRGGGS